MSKDTARFTSPSMAVARFVAQRGLLKPLVWSLVSVRVVGAERLDDLATPFVAIANHSSHLDAPLIMGALPREKARYLAAGAAADYFFKVWWRKWLTTLFFNAYPVDRTGGRSPLNSSRTLLDIGIPILLFPEGGRSKHGVIGRFKPGAASLSASTGYPCVPVALVGASAAMPRGTSWPRRGRHPVAVVFGEPMIAAEGESVEEFSQRLFARVGELHETVAPLPVHAKEGS